MYLKKITLCRPKKHFNKNCSYRILAGNRFLTELSNGQEKTIEIPPEIKNQTLKAKVQWCGSEKIELQNIKENGKIIITGNKFLNKKMPLAGAVFPLIGLIIFDLEVVSRNIGIGLFLIFLIGVVGTVTAWRNRWLNIKIE